MASPTFSQLINPIGIGTLPPCTEPAPFNRDERVIWVFRCGIHKQLNAKVEARLKSIVESIDTWTLLERAEVAAGLTRGLVRGTTDGAWSAVTDLRDLVISASKVIASGYGATFDVAAWEGIQRVLSADPGPKTQQAIDDVVAVIGNDHPEFVEALITAGMVCAVFRSIIHWVSTEPNAAYLVLVALSAQLGKLVGEVAAEIAAVQTPYEIGAVVGDLLGRVIVEALRFYFGI